MGLLDNATPSVKEQLILDRLAHTVKTYTDVLLPLITALNGRGLKTVAKAVTAASTTIDVGEDITTLYGVIIFVGGIMDTGVTAAAVNGTTASQIDFTGTVGGTGYAIALYD